MTQYRGNKYWTSGGSPNPSVFSFSLPIKLESPPLALDNLKWKWEGCCRIMKLVICFQFQFSYYHCISTRPFLCLIYPFRGLILIYATRIPHTSVTPRPRSTHVPCPSNFLIHTPGVSWATDSLKLKDQPPVNDNSQPVTFSVLYI